MEEVASNMTIAVMMMYLACHEVEWKCTNSNRTLFFAILGLMKRSRFSGDTLETASLVVFHHLYQYNYTKLSIWRTKKKNQGAKSPILICLKVPPRKRIGSNVPANVKWSIPMVVILSKVTVVDYFLVSCVMMLNSNIF